MNILDASALLALFKKEKGWEKVQEILTPLHQDRVSVFMHAINFTEFVYKCKKIFGDGTTLQIIADLESPYFGIMNYLETDLNLYSAHLKATYHLSLADATGLANAKIMKGTFWTADSALRPIAQKEEIDLECIR
jgi:predicted nucleic acid-binding protein